MKLQFTKFLIISSIYLFENITYSQSTNSSKTDLSARIDSSSIKGMNDFYITGATIVIVQGDSVLHLKGYGLANVEFNTAVNGDSSMFRIASISKTFVATAIIQLYEDGKIELDRDINNYLTSFK